MIQEYLLSVKHTGFTSGQALCRADMCPNLFVKIISGQQKSH